MDHSEILKKLILVHWNIITLERTHIKPDWIQESGQRWTVAQKWIDTRLKMDGTKTLKKTVINDRVNRSPMRNVVWTLELDS